MPYMELDKQKINPKKKPICSVCIANYNGIEVIDSAILSVMMQDCNFPIEIIVHDDSSSDGSVEYIHKKYPTVKIIQSTCNVGFCISNNRMVSAARGEFILLLNNDAVLFKDAISTLYDKSRMLNNAGILSLNQYDYKTEELIDRGILLDPFLNTVPNFKNSRLSNVSMAIGACLWIPKYLWEEIGGFPEWFHTLGEDMYICCLARLMGYPIKIPENSGFLHMVGNSIGGGKVVNNRLSTRKARRALSERNKSFVMILIYPSPFFQVAILLHILLLLVEGFVLSLVKKDMDILCSIYLTSLKAIWNERRRLYYLRRRIQSMRKITSQKFFAPFTFLPQKVVMLVKYGIPEIK